MGLEAGAILAALVALAGAWSIRHALQNPDCDRRARTIIVVTYALMPLIVFGSFAVGLRIGA